MFVEAGGTIVRPGAFPGQQGRTAFAYLVGRRGTPVARETLAGAIWEERRPAAWSNALSAIVSKLRAVLRRAAPRGGATVSIEGGCYELHLPSDTWVDHEVAAESIHEAEAALQAGDVRRAYGPSAVAHHIARRPFLPGEGARWVEECRTRLARILIRALECRARIYLWNDEHVLAVEAARDAVALERFRETSYQLLMQAHAAAGNVGEALWVYERCRAVLSEELGVGPSPQTRAVHAAVLKGQLHGGGP